MRARPWYSTSMDIDDFTLTPQPDGGAVIEMTVGETTMEHIQRLRELYAEEVPDGDLGKILGLALAALLEEIRELQAPPPPRGH